MKLDIDSHTVGIPCPNCGEKVEETIGRLKTDPNLTCGCGAVIQVDAKDLRSGIDQIERSLNELRRTFRNLGK